MRDEDGSEHELPLRLDYRSELLASFGALANIWMRPSFQADLAAESGLGDDLPALQALRALSILGPSRPSTLAEALGTGRSNVSKILGRLRAAGLVELRPHPEDLRGATAELTARGRAVARRTYDAGDDMAEVVLAGWSERDLERFQRYLERFTRATRDYAERISRRTGGPSA